MRIEEFSFRRGKEILTKRPEVHASILAALINTQEACRGKGASARARRLHQELEAEGWAKGIAEGEMISLVKERVAVEVELAGHEPIYRDYLRLLSIYKAGKITAGVLITNADSRSKQSRGRARAATFGRVKTELEQWHDVITVPIWVVGLK